MDHRVRADFLAFDDDDAVRVGQQIHDRSRRIHEEIEVRERTRWADRRAILHTLGHRRCSRCGHTAWGHAFRAEHFAAGRELFASVGRADRPRVQQQLRTVEHVPRILFHAAAIEHVAIFIADVSPREIDRIRAARIDAARLDTSHSAEVRERGKLRMVACGVDVNAGEFRVIGEADRDVLRVGDDVANLHSFERRNFEMPQRAEDVAVLQVAGDHADADLLPAGFQVQIVVAGCQFLHFDRTVLNRDRIESIGADRATLNFKQCEFIARRFV